MKAIQLAVLLDKEKQRNGTHAKAAQSKPQSKALARVPPTTPRGQSS
jgi:hypothetical protein